MTPTEQAKELDKILPTLQVETKAAKTVLEQFEACDKARRAIDKLITADRKRVELGARRSEALIADRNLGQYPDYHKMKTASLKRIDDIERGLFISVHDLKAQQEDKDE